MKHTLLGGLGISAMIAFSGAAFAQGSSQSSPGSGGGVAGSSPSTGQAPGLQQNRQDAPKGQGQPSARAQERTGMGGDRSYTAPGDKPGSATETKPGETITKPAAAIGAKPTVATTKPVVAITKPEAGTNPGSATGKPAETAGPSTLPQPNNPTGASLEPTAVPNPLGARTTSIGPNNVGSLQQRSPAQEQTSAPEGERPLGSTGVPRVSPENTQGPLARRSVTAFTAARCTTTLENPSAHTAAEVSLCRQDQKTDERMNRLEDANRRAVRSICPSC